MTSAAQNSKQVLAQKGTAATPAYTFLGNNNTGFYLSNTNEISIATNGTQRVIIGATGTVTIPTLNLTNALGISYGGTGQTTASAAFNALSPITSTGDLIIGNGTNSATRLAIGANNYVLTSNGTTAVWAATSSTMVYPGAGIPNSTGSAWGTSYSTTGSGTVVALATSPSFTTPTLGVASATSINKVAITAPATSATLTIADGKTATFSNSITFAGTDSTTMTFPSTSDSITAATNTQTLTNKRINPRVTSAASTTSPLAWTSDSNDEYAYTALANALTLNADAGTPVDGQKIVFRFKDNGTARVLTFTGGVSKGFQPIGVSMTTSGSNFTYTTTINKITYFGCIYNAGDSRWDIVAIAQQA